jgi:hypothetical protein
MVGMLANVEAVSKFIASINEGNTYWKKAKMITNVAARLCRDVTSRTKTLIVAFNGDAHFLL